MGKSRATVYGRIKLLDAPEKSKEAYRTGKLSVQVLLLIARIPNPKVAEEATERVLKGSYNGEPLSFRQVQNVFASEYMPQLKGAPFDPKDITLVPDAGPCAACPKRSGNPSAGFAENYVRSYLHRCAIVFISDYFFLANIDKTSPITIRVPKKMGCSKITFDRAAPLAKTGLNTRPR